MNLSTHSAAQVTDPPSVLDGDHALDVRGVVVGSVDGDVDIYTAPRLLQALRDALAISGVCPEGTADPAPGAESNVTALVVDLTEVDFIDSAAIGVLVQGHHLARRSRCGYAVVATHPMIHTVFAITGLAKVLPLHPGVGAAVMSLQPTIHRPSL